jgi:hypothetical protein
MNAKIFNGFIASSDNPFQVGYDVRRILDAVYYEKFRKIVDVCMSLPEGSRLDDLNDHGVSVPLYEGYGVDLIAWNEDENTRRRAIFRQLWTIMSDLDKNSTSIDPSLNIFWHVTLIENDNGGSVLGLVFSEEGDYYDTLISSESFNERNYWDNADRPDEISEDDWKNRESEWGLLLNDYKTPAEVGLSIDSPGKIKSIMNVIEKPLRGIL